MEHETDFRSVENQFPPRLAKIEAPPTWSRWFSRVSVGRWLGWNWSTTDLKSVVSKGSRGDDRLKLKYHRPEVGGLKRFAGRWLG